MLFGKGFDDTLWTILKADKRHRKEIVDFIKQLPQELFQKIQNDVANFKNTGGLDTVEGSVVLGDEYYTYSIDYDSLEIDKSVKTGEYYDEVFSLSLVNSCSEEISLFCEDWLGDIEHNIITKNYGNGVSTTDSEEIEYEIIRTPLGGLVVYYAESEDKGYRRFVFTTKAPKDFSLKHLNRFTRKRKK